MTTTSAARPVALSTGVAPDYFDVLGVQVLAGRPFGPGDAPGGAAAVVSRSFVRRFLGDGGRAVRFAVVMVGLVTLSVLLLSAVGISAMMSFAVTRRYREIGIRSALGASRRQVLRTIFSRSALQLGLGVAVGAIFTALLDRISGGEFLNARSTCRAHGRGAGDRRRASRHGRPASARSPADGGASAGVILTHHSRGSTGSLSSARTPNTALMRAAAARGG